MKGRCWLRSRKRSRTRRRRSVSYESDSSIEFVFAGSSNRRAKRRKVETSDSDTSSSSDTDPETVATPRERVLRSGVKVVDSSPQGPSFGTPTVVSAGSQSAEQSRMKKHSLGSGACVRPISTVGNPAKQTRAERNISEPGPRRLSAIQARKVAQEAEREAKARRELMIGALTDRIMSSLINLGDYRRDIGHVCSEKFGWDFREWQDVLKEGKVVIYAPMANVASHGQKSVQRKSVHKRVSLGRRVWSAELEVDGLSLCIMKSGGTRVLFSDALHPDTVSQARTSINWDTINDHAELRCVFVHKDSVEDFLSHGRPSVLDLTCSKPRIQLFTFGKAELPSPTSKQIEPEIKIELIFKAGAVIIPTYDILFEKPKSSDKDQRDYYTRLQAACRVHPFLRVCLHPWFLSRVLSTITTGPKSTAAGIDWVDCVTVFLSEIGLDGSTENQVTSWADWVKLPRLKIGSLPQKLPPFKIGTLPQGEWGSEDAKDEVSEFKLIVESLKQIRRDLFKEFRRFIIAIPDNDDHSRNSFLDGMECMEISHLCKLLETDPF